MAVRAVRAEVGDREEGMDEARVGCPAGRAELGLAAERPLDGGREDVADRSGRRQERLAADTDGEVVAPTDGIESVTQPGPQLVARPGVIEADVEGRVRLRRDDVRGRVSDIDGRDLQRR